jgi:hypothetical protein
VVVSLNKQAVGAAGNSVWPKETQMEVTIKTGTILMKEGTLLPAPLETLSDAFLPGWRAFGNLNGYALSKKIEAENWHFFCLAGDLRAIALGRDRQKTLKRAVKRILGKSAGERFNSLEVTEISAKWFLGVPYLRVSAHLRHVQEDILLVSPKVPPGRSAAHVKSAGQPAMVLRPVEE